MTAKTINALEFLISKSIRYHAKKRRFFELLQRVSQTVILAGGSSAFSSIIAKNNSFSLYAAGIVALFGLMDYTFDFSGKVRLHNDLYRRLIDLAVQLMKLEKLDKTSISYIRSERYLIGADSPTVGRVLDVLCHNEEVIARGLPRNEMYYIWPHQKFFSMLFDLPPREFKRIKIETENIK